MKVKIGIASSGWRCLPGGQGDYGCRKMLTPSEIRGQETGKKRADKSLSGNSLAIRGISTVYTLTEHIDDDCRLNARKVSKILDSSIYCLSSVHKKKMNWREV